MWALFDSLLNVVTGLGTAADKSIATTYALPYISPAELEAMYRGDWIAQKAVDLPAQDATREWRSWQADGDTKEKLENEERRLQIQFKCQEAQTLARLYGGAAMVIGVKGQSADTPLDLTRVGKGALEFVDVLHRHELSTGPIIRDPTSLWQKEPEWYTRTDSTQLRIHPSRVVRFLGKPVRSFYSRVATDEGWGDSILMSVRDAVRDAGVAQHAGAALLHDLNVDVYKIPNLTEMASNRKYEDKLMKRFAVSNLSKSMYRALVVDSEEEWERVSAQLTGLPDIVLVYLMLAAGAVDIPATRFLSQSPKGLNATGDSDLKNYYDNVGSEQKNKIQPAMSRLDDVLIASATGGRDPSIFYIWNPLWQSTDAEKADIFLKKAQTHQLITATWNGDPVALQRAHEAQLIDDGIYPGLEQELEESDVTGQQMITELPGSAPGEAPQVGPVTRQALPPPANPRSPVSDGRNARSIFDAFTPKSLYVRRDVLNPGDILSWAKKQGFKNLYDPKELHVTVLYSKQPIDWMKVAEDYYGHPDGKLTIKAGGPRAIEAFGPSDNRVAVLAFACSQLYYRHQEMIAQGASHDYPDYQPHVSFASIEPTVDVTDAKPYNGKIELGPEIFEEVKNE